MKTAISVPDDVFHQAERLAHRAGRSRSDVYSAALRDYVARHDPELVTQALDEAMSELGDDAAADDLVREASLRTLASAEW